MKYAVTAFYKFFDLPTFEKVESELEQLARDFSACGLVILASEGANGTLACPEPHVDDFRKGLQEIIGSFNWKESFSHKKPFRRFRIKIRDEIVTLGRTDLRPDRDIGSASSHLSPDDWHKMLSELPEQPDLAKDNVVLIDTRNLYETKIGAFKGAVKPAIKHFTEFPDFIEQSAIPKDTTVLMYCTGGIRCEKAQLEMKSRGYEKVYQLDGGILNYLKQYPAGYYEGECFVFDHRVAVDANLQPTEKYGLCPHCGDPSDRVTVCKHCGGSSNACEDCIKSSFEKETCSKNCSYHLSREKDPQMC